MTTNIVWTPRERDVVLQTAVFLYRHGRLNMSFPTHNETWRRAMFVLPVNRRRTFTSPSNLGKMYELYMALLVDANKVDMRSAMPGHKEIEWPEHMVIADRISVDALVAFGATLDTAFHVSAPKKPSQQEQIDFLMGEVDHLRKEMAHLKHAFEAHMHEEGDQHWSPGNLEQADARIEARNPKMEIVKGRLGVGEFVLTGAGLNELDKALSKKFGVKTNLEILKDHTGLDKGDFLRDNITLGGTLHHQYPTHALTPDKALPYRKGPLHENAVHEEAEPEGDGIGDDPGAVYDPENYSDMGDASQDKIILGKDIPPEHRPQQPKHEAFDDKPEKTIPHTYRGMTRPQVGFPIEEMLPPMELPTKPSESEIEAAPVLYLYGLPGRLRALLDHYVRSKALFKVNIIHLDDGGKTPVGDVAMVVVHPWMDRTPTARLKLIEKNVTNPRYVESGWDSITEGVRATLASYYNIVIHD